MGSHQLAPSLPPSRQVGDHCQLQPFSLLQDQFGVPETHHSRSLLERAVEAGLTPWLLGTQYRMPGRLSSLVSSLFYGGRLTTAPSLRLRPGQVLNPCRWVQAGGGGEVAHERKGYSNPGEVLTVLALAEAALRVDAGAEVFVTTPYNKQIKALKDAVALRPVLVAATEERRLQVGDVCTVFVALALL